MSTVLSNYPLLLPIITTLPALLFLLRFLSKTSLLQILISHYNSLEARLHVYTLYRVPQHNTHDRPNQLYSRILTYLNSLPSLDNHALSTTLLSGPNPNDIVLQPDLARPIPDFFLGARLSWSFLHHPETSSSSLVLKLKKKDKKRILKPYLEKILSGVEENRELKFHFNRNKDDGSSWVAVPFNHPATMDTVVMDLEIKNKVKSDLENFLKSKQYYHRLGRVWKRSYLLHGGPGTGKSTFIAAVANFLQFNVYDLDLSKVANDGDLKKLLLETTRRAVIVVENFDSIVSEASTTGRSGVSLSGLLDFMDGVGSCCGEEYLTFFTITTPNNNNGRNYLDQIDPTVMRPGRIDERIEFPTCDNFSAFKGLASSYLGVKEHKLFPEIKEILEGGASMSPAEIGEIMISNRSSPTRALKSVLTALRRLGSVRGGSVRSSGGGEEELSGGGVICTESVHTVREFRKLYGLLRVRSRRKSEDSTSLDLGSIDKKDGSRHDKEGSRHGV